MFYSQNLDDSDVQEAQQKMAVEVVLKKGRFKGKEIWTPVNRGKFRGLAQCKSHKLHPLEEMSAQIPICILIFTVSFSMPSIHVSKLQTYHCFQLLQFSLSLSL